MKLLLDTQVFIWYVEDSDRLSPDARTQIERANVVFISAVSIWEAAIKSGIGKLRVDVHQLSTAIEASGFVELPVRVAHAMAVRDLPDHHRDPFDRLLVAQAVSEPLRFLTADELLQRYSPLIQVV